MDYKCEMIETAAQPVLFVRTVTSVGNLPQELGKAYGAVISYLTELGEQPSESAAFACYYNMDMENLDVGMGFPVGRELPGKGRIEAGVIPAGKKLTCLHRGSYQDSAKAYDAMTQWMKENGEEPTGVAYEFYYNSPLEVPEGELLTRIVFPLK